MNPARCFGVGVARRDMKCKFLRLLSRCMDADGQVHRYVDMVVWTGNWGDAAGCYL